MEEIRVFLAATSFISLAISMCSPPLSMFSGDRLFSSSLFDDMLFPTASVLSKSLHAAAVVCYVKVLFTLALVKVIKFELHVMHLTRAQGNANSGLTLTQHSPFSFEVISHQSHKLRRVRP